MYKVIDIYTRPHGRGVVVLDTIVPRKDACLFSDTSTVLHRVRSRDTWTPIYIGLRVPTVYGRLPRKGQEYYTRSLIV